MGEDRRRKRIQKEQHAYVDRLRHYRNKGIDIFIDGKMTRQEREWYRIVEVREDGAVYMADYVNSRQGRLSEIHFDLVYLDLSAHQAWENKKRLEDAMRKAQVQHYKTVLQKQQRS